jgi:hypothetical protein
MTYLDAGPVGQRSGYDLYRVIERAGNANTTHRSEEGAITTPSVTSRNPANA